MVLCIPLGVLPKFLVNPCYELLASSCCNLTCAEMWIINYDCLSENRPSSHLPVFREIPF